MARHRYVIEGPRWFRSEIRHKGPLYALVPPVVLGAVALVSINLFESQLTGWLGLATAYFSVPALPAVGAPFSGSDRHLLAIAVSAALWVVIGIVASRRATRDPMATWTDFWRNYAWLAGGIWLGTIVALAVAGLSIGSQFF